MANYQNTTKNPLKGMSLIEGDSFLMGSDSGEGFEIDKEGPAKEVKVDDFYIDETTVTNQDFLEFFQATGYITEAERFGSSNVFHIFLSEEEKEKWPTTAGNDVWYEVGEASWRQPTGPGSSIEDWMDHPVVHVSRNDALAYCAWADKRLPTEAEWEYAGRAGHDHRRFPWGDDLEEGGKHHANTWQGEFPYENTAEDGYVGTAPAKSFSPNDYGLYQMIGNVWEWCLNPGRIDLSEFQEKTSFDFFKENYQPSQDVYALKGGSFLCHHSYCQRYRLAGRNANTGHSSTSNTGFRCVRDIFEEGSHE